MGILPMLVGLGLGQLIALLNSGPHVNMEILDHFFTLLFASQLNLLLEGMGIKSKVARGLGPYTI